MIHGTRANPQNGTAGFGSASSSSQVELNSHLCQTTRWLLVTPLASVSTSVQCCLPIPSSSLVACVRLKERCMLLGRGGEQSLLPACIGWALQSVCLHHYPAFCPCVYFITFTAVRITGVSGLCASGCFHWHLLLTS